MRVYKESNIKCEWKQRFATRTMLFYCLLLIVVVLLGLISFLRCQFWYEVNSFSFTVSDHLAGNLSKGLVTSHICWLRARVPHHVPLWYWQLMKVFGTITSRGLLCPWLVHWLHFSENLLPEIIIAISYFHRAFLMYPSASFQIHCLLLFCQFNVHWWEAIKLNKAKMLQLISLEVKIFQGFEYSSKLSQIYLYLLNFPWAFWRCRLNKGASSR